MTPGRAIYSPERQKISLVEYFAGQAPVLQLRDLEILNLN
jgi:hypothetical protein